jgi:glycosyltransferase involved in cell wall biosynthesis
MLDAFAALAREAPEMRLVFVSSGDDPLLRGIRDKVRALHLEPQVMWLPFQEDIRRIECAADVVALPSDQEALGTCILEAMSLCLAVVVSRNGGTHELIEDGISALTVPGGDAQSLTSALRNLARRPDLRARLGSEARRRVEQRFTPRVHAQLVKRVFEKARR